MFAEFIAQLAATNWVEWLGMGTGLGGVWLSIKGKVAAWPLFIACYGCYVFISYDYGLTAFLWMNVAFIGISCYGFWRWLKPGQAAADSRGITRLTAGQWPLLLLLVAAGTLGIGSILDVRGTSTLPFFDALATSCGFAAQWLLSRKQLETWLFWIVSDIVYLGIFIQGGSWPSVLLFTVFTILAVKGWREWSKNVLS